MAANPLISQLDLPAGNKDVQYMGFVLNWYYSRVEGKDDPEKYRFQVELEFVQCLANPQYLNCK